MVASSNKKSTSVWDRNFAEDKALGEQIASALVPRIRLTRTNRLPLEEALWRHFNMWLCTKDGYASYNGRAQLYIPEVRKNVEAQARQLTKSAFPSDDCFDVSPGLTGTRRGALAWKSLHQWGMRNSQLPLKYFIAMRQQCLLGTSPIYIPWRKITRKEFRSRRDNKTRKIGPTRQEVELFNGPDFIPRDLFRWYTFNPKKMDLSDGCFEITAANAHDVKDLARRGLCARSDEVLKSAANAYMQEEFSRDVMRAFSEGINIQYNMGYAGEATLKKDVDPNEADRSYLCHTIFVDMVFPEACEPDEDPEIPIPLKIQIWGNNICGLIQRNPFYHQSPPYVVGRYIMPNADEFYGQGIPWATQYMQLEMNSKAEQGMDSATLALNPIAIIDPGLAGESNDFDVMPGAKWLANPAGVKLASLPDVTPTAYQAINQLKMLMENYSDRSPALPPQLLGKSRTATQSEMVFDSLGVDNWLFQLQNEQMILTPMLQQWESLTDQNMDDTMLVMILGRRAGDLKRTLLAKSDVLGRYAYQWKGASSSSNKQVIARQMLDFLKIITSLPPQMVQGLNFNGSEFCKVLYSDLWALPDSDKILGMPEEMITQDAEAENKMVEMGLEIEVLPSDDDEGHMPIHDKGIEAAKTEQEKTILMAHNLEHKKSAEMKKKIQEQMAQMQAMQQILMIEQAQQGGQGRKRGSGNRTQMSPNASGGDMASGIRA